VDGPADPVEKIDLCPGLMPMESPALVAGLLDNPPRCGIIFLYRNLTSAAGRTGPRAQSDRPGPVERVGLHSLSEKPYRTLD
jgi:hypothetical protein